MAFRPPRRDFLASFVAVSTLALLARPVRAAAKSANIRARLDPPAIQLEEESELTIEIDVADTRLEVSRPRLSGAEVLKVSSTGTSMSTSVVYDNGRPRMAQTRVFTYLVSARKTGSFQIEVETTVGDDVIKLGKPLTLHVTDDPAAREAASPKLGEDETVVVTKASPQEVYVGQEVRYVFEAWERGEGQLNPETLPSFKDCWVEALPRPDTRIERGGGVRYRVHTPMLQALFPQIAGKLVISAPVLRLQPSAFGSLFGGRGATRSRLIAGKEQQINVLPLPKEGQPPGFAANNVGSFAIITKVDQTSVTQGDALTLVIEISGQGNIRMAELEGWPDIVGVRRYDAKSEDPELDTSGEHLRGKKRWSILLIAQQAGQIVIPAHAISFFDPERKRYDRAVTEPITINVAAKAGFVADSDAKQAESADAKDSDGANAANQELADLVNLFGSTPISRQNVRGNRSSPWLAKSDFWPLWTSLPFGFAALTWFGSKAKAVWSNAARAHLAAQKARDDAWLAKIAPGSSDREFLAAMHAMLQDRALAWAGPQGQGVPRKQLLDLVKQAHPDEEGGLVVSRVGELLDRCDAARFGAGQLDASTREKMAAELRELLDTTAKWPRKEWA
jgi:hypothetical protein